MRADGCWEGNEPMKRRLWWRDRRQVTAEADRKDWRSGGAEEVEEVNELTVWRHLNPHYSHPIRNMVT